MQPKRTPPLSGMCVYPGLNGILQPLPVTRSTPPQTFLHTSGVVQNQKRVFDSPSLTDPSTPAALSIGAALQRAVVTRPGPAATVAHSPHSLRPTTSAWATIAVPSGEAEARRCACANHGAESRGPDLLCSCPSPKIVSKRGGTFCPERLEACQRPVVAAQRTPAYLFKRCAWVPFSGCSSQQVFGSPRQQC